MARLGLAQVPSVQNLSFNNEDIAIWLRISCPFVAFLLMGSCGSAGHSSGECSRATIAREMESLGLAGMKAETESNEPRNSKEIRDLSALSASQYNGAFEALKRNFEMCKYD